MTQKNPISTYVFPGLNLKEIDSEKYPFIKTINKLTWMNIMTMMAV